MALIAWAGHAHSVSAISTLQLVSSSPPPAENFTCTDGSIRLVGGQAENEGRVEVCFSNQYGTICDDQWDNNEASVVCGQLGFSRERTWLHVRCNLGVDGSYFNTELSGTWTLCER